MGQSLAVSTISRVVQSGRSELLALRRRTADGRDRHVDRESWEAAEEASAIDESDREIYERLFVLYDKRGAGAVHVLEFLVGLATIVNASLEERLHIALELWDIRGTGYLGRADTLAVLVSMNKACGFFGDNQLAYDQLDELVQSLFDTLAPRLVDDKLSYRDHAADIATHPIMEIFVGRQDLAAVAETARR